jgi:hypothetical protein
MAKDSEFFTIAKDAKRLTSIEYRRHPLSNFSPEQYLQITRSQAPDLGNDNSPAFAVYLKSLMTDDLFKSIKKKYKDATSSGVSAEDAIDEVLMSHELEQVLDAAVHQYTGSQYNSVFLAQRTRKYPDEISKERALRAIREEIKQNSSLKGAELLTENRKAQRSRKERAIEKGADLINAEIRSISLNGEPALLLARGSFVEADAVSEKLTPIDKASYQKLKNLYIELFLLDDQTLAKEKVSSSFGGRLLNKKAEIEAKINAIRAKGDGASVEELEELEQLDAGIHPLNIELKKIYAAFRKAVNGELENIRREKGPNYRARPYNGRLEEKKSIILREAKKLIIQAVETSDDPSHLRTPLERMNDLRTRLGERGLLEIFREAKIYSNPRDEVLTHISNILSDKTLLNQLPSFNGVTKAREILAAFFRLPISGGRLLSASGRLYTLQARAFQNLEVRPVVEDFIRALVTLQKISDGAVPTAGVFAIADLGEVVVPQEWIDWGDNAQRLAIDQLTSYGSTLEISSPDNTIHSVTQDFKLFTLDIAYLIALFSISADERGKFVLRNEQSALVEPLLEKEVFTRISDMITPLNPSEERILTKMLDRAKQSNNVFQNKILTEEGDQATWDDLLDSLSERAYDKIAKEFAKKDMGSFLKAKDKNKVKLLSAVGFAKLLQDEKHYTESDAFIVKVIDIATKDQLRELLEDIEYEIESIDYTQKHIYMMSSFYKGLIEEKLTRIA